MFRFPDFFKVAVSEAGNHDNRTYGYWWGEISGTAQARPRVVDALIKADKDFDMLIIPDSPHGFPDYAIKKGWDYFVRYRAGGTPPVNYHLLPTPRTTVVAGAPEE